MCRQPNFNAASTAAGQSLIERERALLRLDPGKTDDEARLNEVIAFNLKRQEGEGKHCKSIDAYLGYLASSGFDEVECLWQDYWMAVFVARKSMSDNQQMPS